MALTIGRVLNQRYRIVRLLGQGGFGAVYRAWDIHLGIPCAVKESFGVSSEDARQFLREAQMLATLRHPNLPKVTDHFGIPEPGQYLVMEYVEGEDLEEIRSHRGDQLQTQETLIWILQILDALDYLHKQNPPIIHRDIKPTNIRVTPQGDAVLVDFGIAKQFDAQFKTNLGARAFTPGYSPIEQYGQGATDQRSDIYAVGATLYALLTGRVPVESSQRILADPLESPDRLNPALSAGLSQTIMKALMIDPRERWQTIAEMKYALRQILNAEHQEGLSTAVGPTEKQIPASPPPIFAGFDKEYPEKETILRSRPDEASRGISLPLDVKKSRRNSSRFLIIGGISLGTVLFLGMLLIGGTLYFNNNTRQPAATNAPVLLVEPTRKHVDPSSSPTRSEPVPSREIPPAVEPIRVGLLVPLSGPVQEYGISVLEGVTLSVEQWNARAGIHGRPIELLVSDTRCEAEIAAVEANRLIDNEQVKFIIGEVCSIASIPVAEIVNKRNVLQISPASTNVQLTVDETGLTRKYTFRTCFIDSFQANKLAQFAYEEGFRQVFIIQDPGDVYSRNLAESFHTSFLDLGGEVVGLADFEREQVDFSAILSRIVESKAQLLFVPAYYDMVNRFGRQARELGVAIKMLGGDGWDSPALDLRALEGSFYSTHFNPIDPNPDVRAWVELYGSRYKTEIDTPKIPSAFAALGYDSATLLFQALDAVGQADPTLIAEFLQGYETRLLTGVMHYDQQHNPIKPLVIMGIRSDGVYFARQIEPVLP